MRSVKCSFGGLRRFLTLCIVTAVAIFSFIPTSQALDPIFQNQFQPYGCGWARSIIKSNNMQDAVNYPQIWQLTNATWIDMANCTGPHEACAQIGTLCGGGVNFNGNKVVVYNNNPIDIHGNIGDLCQENNPKPELRICAPTGVNNNQGVCVEFTNGCEDRVGGCLDAACTLSPSDRLLEAGDDPFKYEKPSCNVTPQPGQECNDNNPCTTDDICVFDPQGNTMECVGDPTFCSTLVTPQTCAVNQCNPNTGVCESVPYANGTPCTVLNKCQNGECQNGACVGVQDIAPPPAGACTPPQVCNPNTGQWIDDPNWVPQPDCCTTDDDCNGFDDSCNVGVCNLQTKLCEQHAINPLPNLGPADACTNVACVLQPDGTAVKEPFPIPDPLPPQGDNPFCQLRHCDPQQGWIWVNEGIACDDGSQCLEGSLCKEGNCQGGAPVNCNNNGPLPNQCTQWACSEDVEGGCYLMAIEGENCCQTDEDCALPNSCYEGAQCVNNECVYDPVEEGAPCNTDNNLCTIEACQFNNGFSDCHLVEDVQCGTDEPCKYSRCIPETGACQLFNLPDGPNPTCDDSKACTEEQCVAGACQPTDDNVCDDLNNGPCVCKEVPANPNLNQGATYECQYGDACPAPECGEGMPECNDNNPCTKDECVANACQFTPDNNGDACDDGNLDTCTDICKEGQCVGTLVPLNPDPCFQNICTHNVVQQVPQPGSVCHTGDICTEGVCNNSGVCEEFAIPGCGEATPIPNPSESPTPEDECEFGCGPGEATPTPGNTPNPSPIPGQGNIPPWISGGNPVPGAATPPPQGTTLWLEGSGCSVLPGKTQSSGMEWVVVALIGMAAGWSLRRHKASKGN